MVDLGVPEGEEKVKVVIHFRFTSMKEAKQELKKLQDQAALGMYLEKKKISGTKSLTGCGTSTGIFTPTQTMAFQEVF